jgi:hypothetical protein
MISAATLTVATALDALDVLATHNEQQTTNQKTQTSPWEIGVSHKCGGF